MEDSSGAILRHTKNDIDCSTGLMSAVCYWAKLCGNLLTTGNGIRR